MYKKKCGGLLPHLKVLVNLKKEVIDRNTVLVNKLLFAETDPVNKLLLTGTISDVCRCWLAMPLGAGIQRDLYPK